VVPGDFIGYFPAAGTAAGTLIGLLFVAVSRLASMGVTHPRARPGGFPADLATR
jgi:hypothetical protein